MKLFEVRTNPITEEKFKIYDKKVKVKDEGELIGQIYRVAEKMGLNGQEVVAKYFEGKKLRDYDGEPPFTTSNYKNEEFDMFVEHHWSEYDDVRLQNKALITLLCEA